jgi:hypothetical protein
MGGKWLPGCFVSARPWPGADSASGYIKRVTCLQVECANNQRFFKNSEAAEFFAASCLVISKFFRNFKIAG